MSVWSLVKLELAESADHPRGSVSRSYFIRIPLDQAGMIDNARLADAPMRATARRFWPSRPDKSGYVVRSQEGWNFCDPYHSNGQNWFAAISDRPVVAGALIEISESGGRKSRFRVTEIEPL